MWEYRIYKLIFNFNLGEKARMMIKERWGLEVFLKIEKELYYQK